MQYSRCLQLGTVSTNLFQNLSRKRNIWKFGRRPMSWRSVCPPGMPWPSSPAKIPSLLASPWFCGMVISPGGKLRLGNLRDISLIWKGKKHYITNPKKHTFFLGGCCLSSLVCQRCTKKWFFKGHCPAKQQKIQKHVVKERWYFIPQKNHGTGIFAYMNSWFVW